jgi:hypothetical protein
VPVSRRAAVSRQAGWISPVVLVGGVVCGTWRSTVTTCESRGSRKRAGRLGLRCARRPHDSRRSSDVISGRWRRWHSPRAA